MKTELITRSEQLSYLSDLPEHVAHVFAERKDDTIFMMTIFPVGKKLFEVRRSPYPEVFKAFLKRCRIERQYYSFRSYLEEELEDFYDLVPDKESLPKRSERMMTIAEIIQSGINPKDCIVEKFRKTHSVLLEFKLIGKTIFHSLDFADTVLFNWEPKNMNATVKSILKKLHGPQAL